ncbi:chemotaxis protein CheC [Singulisphaera sp. GP187]|uniref:chemotaxis protein CheC n=1 Tax=Singulisphaera sp. GP187 TaxID=1882752 RepID=UPI0009280F62|nr:chemotaxis protein CheC [Singulisphaera sp. GP187]SIO56700.1 chemotaxis protein CheC [Singulisphaera sp. GP187]
MRLDPYQEDALREVINIGIGRAAATLSELMGTRIELSIPSIAVYEFDDWLGQGGAGGMGVAVVQDFEGPCSGRAVLVLPLDSGLRMAQILGGVEDGSDELDLELSGILAEVGNIMINAVLGSLANATGARLSYGLPEFYSEPELAFLSTPVAGEGVRGILIADTHFHVRQFAVRGSLLIAFERGGIEVLVQALCATESDSREVR